MDAARAMPAIGAANVNVRSLVKGLGSMIVPVAVIVVVMMLLIPLPTILLDMLMAMNLVLSLLIILTVVYTRKVTEFSQFPTMLLVSTVFGLALNVSSTRLILSKGEAFDGRMVRAFAGFVTGGGSSGLVIGAIIFLIIIVVQVVVITKGSTRIAEVMARFSLDAMNSKYMAIDVDLHSGAIDEKEARLRREDLQRAQQFYGAMDGAAKFIAGNVKAGIFITVVNILGGIIIGTAIHHEGISSAFGTYIAFAIGDGLLSQFPGLLISTATGLIVTRADSIGSFSEDLGREFSLNPKIYWVAAGFIFVLAFIPGFPWYVLLPLSAVLGFAAYSLTRKESAKTAEKSIAEKEAAGAKKAGTGEEMSPIVPLDPLSLEVGFGLLPLLDKDRGAELLERIKRMRRESAIEMGLVIPKVRIIDNMRLDSSEYCFKIKGMEVGKAKIRMGHYLCIITGAPLPPDFPGERTVDPTFGLPAIWVDEEHRGEAERMGLTVVDPPSIIATHMTELIRTHADEILGRQNTQEILDTLKKDYPAVVEDAQKNLSLGEIQKVLQALLHERVSIRNTTTILETLADYAGVTKNVPFLVEKARQALGRQICLQYADDGHNLHVLTLSHSLEQTIVESAVETAGGRFAAMQPDVHTRWIQALSKQTAMVKHQGWAPPLILCSETARPLVKQSCERELPEVVVLSVREITSDINVTTVGEVGI